MNALRCTAIISMLIFCALVPGPATAQALEPDVIARIDAAMQKSLTESKTTGVVLGIAENGKLVYERAYGAADLAGTPLTPETPFEIGSITKQFTAAAILQLVEAHKLSLSDRLGKFVPSYAAGRAITIRQLLNQVTGIAEYTDTIFEHPPKTPGTFSAMLKIIADKPLLFAPGTQWKYSNTNYIMLGRVIELISHEPYDKYIHDHIFVPAGMTHSTTWSAEPNIAHFPTGYTLAGGKVVVAPHIDSGWASSAGDIVSTVSDMVKWDNAFFSGKIIKPADVKIATSALKLPNGKSTEYGFGWVIGDIAGHRMIWHNGGTAGFLASNMVFPKEHLALIAYENIGEGLEPQRITARAFGAMYPQAEAALKKAQTQPAPGEDTAVTAKAKDWLRRAQKGDFDRAGLTPKMAAALTPDVVAAAKAQFAPLGEPTSIVYKGKAADADGNMTYAYTATWPTVTLTYYFGLTKDGKVSTLLLRP